MNLNPTNGESRIMFIMYLDRYSIQNLKDANLSRNRATLKQKQSLRHARDCRPDRNLKMKFYFLLLLFTSSQAGLVNSDKSQVFTSSQGSNFLAAGDLKVLVRWNGVWSGVLMPAVADSGEVRFMMIKSR